MRVRAEGRQAIPRFAPGTLWNQCRSHKTKKSTAKASDSEMADWKAAGLEADEALPAIVDMAAIFTKMYVAFARIAGVKENLVRSLRVGSC